MRVTLFEDFKVAIDSENLCRPSRSLVALPYMTSNYAGLAKYALKIHLYRIILLNGSVLNI